MNVILNFKILSGISRFDYKHGNWKFESRKQENWKFKLRKQGNSYK